MALFTNQNAKPVISGYNAIHTVITVDEVNITGLGEDMWNFEKEEDLAENTVGAQGDVVRNVINNPIYTATITVQRTCPQMPHLLSLKNKTEPFPIWMKNSDLGLIEGGTMAMLASAPATSLGASAEDVEFVFTVYDGSSTTTTK